MSSSESPCPSAKRGTRLFRPLPTRILIPHSLPRVKRMDGLLSADGCLQRPGDTGRRGQPIRLVNPTSNDGLAALIDVDRVLPLDYNHPRSNSRMGRDVRSKTLAWLIQGNEVETYGSTTDQLTFVPAGFSRDNGSICRGCGDHGGRLYGRTYEQDWYR